MVRHGQTEWNTEKRLQGRSDSPLTDLGRQQALAAGRALAQQPFAAAWCSTAPRALHTADLLAQARHAAGSPAQQFQATDALAEMHFGTWEGHTRPEIEARWGEKATHFWVAPERWEPFGGESFAQAEARILAFLAHATPLTKSRAPVLLVTHGMMIQLLVHALSGNPLAQLYKTPFVVQASLTRLLVRNRLAPSTWEVLSAGEILS